VRWRWIAAAVVVLALGAGLFYYFTSVPDELAADYVDSAEPEHEKVVDAMEPVYDTFTIDTFGVDQREIQRAKTIARYLRALGRAVERERVQLRSVREDLDEAREALEDVDEDALTDVPDWPALGGRGDLADAEDIADDEQAYLAAVQKFLDEYDELIDYSFRLLRFSAKAGRTAGRGVQRLPENPGSPEAVARPLDRLAARLSRQARGLRRGRPPRDLRRDQNLVAAEIAFYARKFRGLARAVRAQDLAAVNRFDREVTQGGRRYARRGRSSLRRLVARSDYSRAIERLEDRERDIEDAYERV
jgi:hypothetical protein